MQFRTLNLELIKSFCELSTLFYLSLLSFFLK
jgi:hypothetical protein